METNTESLVADILYALNLEGDYIQDEMVAFPENYGE